MEDNFNFTISDPNPDFNTLNPTLPEVCLSRAEPFQPFYNETCLKSLFPECVPPNPQRNPIHFNNRPHPSDNHAKWYTHSKSIPSGYGVHAQSPSSDGVHDCFHYNRVPNMLHSRLNIRAAFPPRGGAGEPRPRPADTENAKPRLRNTIRGIRSAQSRNQRIHKRKQIRKQTRRLVRAYKQIGFSIPPGGQEADHSISRKNYLKSAARKLAKTQFDAPNTCTIPFNRILISGNTINRQHDINNMNAISEESPVSSKEKSRITAELHDTIASVFKFKHINHYRTCELNTRGCNDRAKRNLIDKWAYQNKLDVLCLSETKVNSNCVIKTKNYTWYFSTKVDIKDKNLSETLKHENKQLGIDLRLKITEHHGVGIAIRNKLLPAVTQVSAINNRLMYTQLTGAVDTFIISAYAPTSVDTDQNKDSFYNAISDLWAAIPGNYVKIMCGDFNAKIIQRIGEDEQNTIGRFFLKAEEGTFDRTATTTLDNRQRFINMCIELGLTICNTRFEKTAKKLCTHKPISTVRQHAEWNYESFDQIDYVLINNRFKNSCTDCETDPDAPIDSDHYPLWANFKLRLKIPNTPKRIPKTNRKQNEDNLKDFRDRFLKHCDSEMEAQKPVTENTIDEAFVEAACCLEQRTPAIKKPWISEHTYQLIIAKHKAEENGPSEQLTQLIKDVRKAKRKDWRHWVKQSVDEDMDVRDKWLGIKFLKKKHAPNLYERADMHGNTVNFNDKAKATAEYLSTKQWGIPVEPLNNDAVPNDYYTCKRNTKTNDYNQSSFTLLELKAVIKKMKRNKACGPDDIPIEYFKWLNDPSLEYVLDLLNQWWNGQQFPINKLKADIASIYKKGNPNYRKTTVPSPYLTPSTKFTPL